MKDNNFNWNDEADHTVVTRQLAVAVYRNLDGEIVVRQEGYLGEEDHFIVLNNDAARAVARAIDDLIMLGDD